MNTKFDRVKEKLPDLAYLSKCSPKIRKYILENSDKKLIYAIQECILNFLKGNYKLEPRQFNKLKKYKASIRLLVDNNNCFKKNKKILVQKGGFLQFLLPVAVDLIGNIVSNTLFKQND